MTKEEQLNGVLMELKKTLPELKSVVLGTTDGLPLTQEGPESPRVAAMAATVLGLANRISQTARIGEMQEVIIQGEEGYFFVFAVGEKGVLALVAPSHANLGLIHLEAKGYAQRLSEVL